MSTRPAPKRIYLLTAPRCGSHLLQRILSGQPDCDHSSYHFFGVWLRSALEAHYNKVGPLDRLEPEEREKLEAKFQTTYAKLQAQFESTEKAGCSSIVKEHVLFLIDPLNVFKTRYPEDAGPPFSLSSSATDGKRTSPCIVPDDFLLSIQPVFQIRHPALMFPSAARATKDTLRPDQDVDSPFEDNLQTLRWSRALYEWYVEHGVEPVIIDADDVMSEDRGAMERLCKATGLDPNCLVYEWEPKVGETSFAARFMSTINASTGIVKGLTAAGIDVNAEEQKWSKEFGAEHGATIASRVKDAMPDYEWLRARKL